MLLEEINRWSTALMVWNGANSSEQCLNELRSHVSTPESLYLIDEGKNIAGTVFHPIFNSIISKYILGNFCISMIGTVDEDAVGWTFIINNNGVTLMRIPLRHVLQDLISKTSENLT